MKSGSKIDIRERTFANKIECTVRLIVMSSSDSIFSREYSVSGSGQCSNKNQAMMQHFLEQLELEKTRRLNEFSNLAQKYMQEADRSKVFIFPVGRYSQDEMPINLNSTCELHRKDYDQMKLREKEISAKLKKIKAIEFVLESEQHTLRRKISQGPPEKERPTR